MIRWLVTLILVVVIFAALWVRLSPNPPQQWSVDPLTTGEPGSQNGYLIRPDGGDAAAPVYAVSAAELAKRINAIALNWPRTHLIAGSPGKGGMTYITRSLIWGFPDFTSINVIALGEDRSTFAAFARSRFGKSDLGVNKARLEAWLKDLAKG